MFYCLSVYIQGLIELILHVICMYNGCMIGNEILLFALPVSLFRGHKSAAFSHICFSVHLTATEAKFMLLYSKPNLSKGRGCHL